MSPACDVSNDDARQLQDQRTSLIEILSSFYFLQSPSSEVVSGTLSTLAEASQRPDQLSLAASSQLFSTLSLIVDEVRGHGDIDVDSLSNVATVLDSVMKSSSTNGLSVIDIAALLTNYTTLIANDLFVGEEGKTMLFDSFRVQAEIVPVSSSAGNCSRGQGTRHLALSATNLEVALRLPSRDVSFPFCPYSQQDQGSTELSVVSVTAASISMSAWTNTSLSSDYTASDVALNDSSGVVPGSFLTDTLTMRFSSFPASTGSERMIIRLPLEAGFSEDRAEQSRFGGEVYQHNCTVGSFVNISFPCRWGSGSNVSGTCRGISEMIELRCPVYQLEPGCFFLSMTSSSGEAGDLRPLGIEGGCVVLNRTSTSLVCSCPILDLEAFAAVTTDRRRFLLGNGSSALIPTGEVSVSYVGMLQVVSKSFVNTVMSAKDLNANKIESSVAAVVTLGVIVISVVLAIFFANRFDEEALRKISTDPNRPTAEDPKESRVGRSVHALIGKRGLISRDNRSSVSHRESVSHKVPRQPVLRSSHYTNPIFSMAEEALPSILGARSLWSRMLAELKRHHRWIGVVYFFSPQLPRLLRVVSLATNIIIMLFMQSVTYNITKGDDGSCTMYQTEFACLEPSSPYAPGSGRNATGCRMRLRILLVSVVSCSLTMISKSFSLQRSSPLSSVHQSEWPPSG